jgi:putative tryptophan/tyrosine transport system substrate-binding protein
MKGKPGTVCNFALAVVLGITLCSTAAGGDHSGEAPRIDVLIPPGTVVREQDGLREALNDLGYVEGKSIDIEWRRHGQTERDLKQLEGTLAQSKADLFVAFGTPAARSALSATNKPVVFVAGDPVGTGLAASLARPGGNATGVSMLVAESVGKRMELLHQLVPRMRRVALLKNPDNPLEVLIFANAQQAARELEVQLITLEDRIPRSSIRPCVR